MGAIAEGSDLQLALVYGLLYPEFILVYHVTVISSFLLINIAFTLATVATWLVVLI